MHPKQKQDRFINSSKLHPQSYYSYQYEPNQKFHVNDSQLIKLYKNLLLEDESKQNHRNTKNNIFSMKKQISPKTNFLFKNTQYWQQNTMHIDILSQKFKIDPAKVLTGPNLINKSDKILEAQSLTDNFYLNLLDCSKVTSVLGVALSRGIYLWKPQSSSISRIRQLNSSANNLVNSIKWHPKSENIMACGSRFGHVQIWDTQKNKMVQSFDDHESRVGVLAWGPNCLLSGSRDSKILMYDTRCCTKIGKYHGHNQEICSLGLNSEQQIVASGSNDKKVHLWELKYIKNKKNRINCMQFVHTAAVKGLSWHPVRYNILATGGGTEDRKIRIINSSLNQIVQSIDTGSQICNLMYMKNGQRLVSTHGFNRFEANIWKSSSQGLKKQASLLGHTKRVLYLTMDNSQNGYIITGAGDQSIRFWKNIFQQKYERSPEKQKRLSLR